MRLHKNAKIELLKRVPLFSRCTKKELEAIAAESDELFLPEGSELTKQGGHGREFMVIAEGSADVKKNNRRINQLGSGDFLGEIALALRCAANRDRDDHVADAAARAHRPRVRPGDRLDAVDSGERHEGALRAAARRLGLAQPRRESARDTRGAAGRCTRPTGG